MINFVFNKVYLFNSILVNVFVSIEMIVVYWYYLGENFAFVNGNYYKVFIDYFFFLMGIREDEVVKKEQEIVNLYYLLEGKVYLIVFVIINYNCHLY